MNKISTPEELDILDQACRYVEQKAMSLRQASAWFESKTGKSISYEGIRKNLKRREHDRERDYRAKLDALDRVNEIIEHGE